jgi:hypothetical protein
MVSPRLKRSSRVLPVAALAAAAALLTGCGSSSTDAPSSPTAQVAVTGQGHAPPSPAKQRARATTPRATTLRAHAGPQRDKVHRSGTVAVGHGRDPEPSGGVHVINPCSLITAQEVASIIGRPVEKAVEAPLGPTCIYPPRAPNASGGHGGAHHAVSIEVTIAVNIMSFKSATARLTHVISGKVDGRPELCGVIGHPIAFVSLSNGRVMTVTAPCPLAAVIAKTAVPHVHGA